MKSIIIQKQLERHGFPGSMDVEESSTVSCLEAKTDLQTQQMTIHYNPSFAPHHRALQKFTAAKRITSPLDECLQDAAGHECGHVHLKDGRSCPGTVEEHEESFYTPIFTALKEKGKESATDSIANLVEDLIDNTLLAQHQSSSGLTLFYEDVARKNKGQWQKAFEAYMRVQSYCWADAKERELLGNYYSIDTKVIAATQNIISKLKLQRGHSQEFLADQKNWKKISTVMAEELADLIEPSMSMPRCGFGKVMEGAMKDPTNRQKFSVKRFTQGGKKPAYMSQEEALDHIYSHQAKQIPLKVDSISRQESFPAVPYQYTPFNPKEHVVEKINWRRPVIVAESPFGGHLSFQVAEHHYELPLQVKLGTKSFPKLKYGLVDCSGTMKLGLPDGKNPGGKNYIPWGDQSRYHYSCRAWYGLVEFLARQGILPNVEVSAGVFSDETRIGKGLEEAKRVLLSPQFSGTYLDIQKIEQMFSGEKSVFFTISDGEISNWDAVGNTFIRCAKDHYYFHLQIGPESVATKSLRKAKLPVYMIRTGQELEQIAINLTREAYGEYIQSVAAQLRGAS
ncbi:MAG TPA: hypothetical protein VJI32_06115 [Candidatus Nanoarchaeia archaeon]|nr:hypothetical protein [Candidatus Nanoarchaeia archaeon]